MRGKDGQWIRDESGARLYTVAEAAKMLYVCHSTLLKYKRALGFRKRQLGLTEEDLEALRRYRDRKDKGRRKA